MIRVRNLSKRFGAKVAVNDISFEVKKGEVLGFLGPNGAGKSTTMRIITGYIPPSAGDTSVADIDVVESPVAAKAKFGYLPENAPLYSELTVSGFLSFIAELRGLTGARKRSAVDRVIDMCYLQSVRHQSVDTLSKGFRHRTCLAQSIIHDPEILIMDEPTDGLDPNQKHEVRSLIKRMGEEKAIIFSTHILEEVEAACTRAIIINNGSIVANGTPDELKAKSDRAGAVLFDIHGRSGVSLREELEKLPPVSRIDVVAQEDNSLRGFAMPGSNQRVKLCEEIFRYAAGKNAVLRELAPVEGKLDEVFRKITTSETAAASSTGGGEGLNAH